MHIAFLFCSSFVHADEYETDTAHVRKLQTLTVNGQRLHVARASMPLQIISEKEISVLNALNVTDIAKYFSGVIVKDYGGIGGLKTVSLHGMGAKYTGVSYDGAMLSDMQSGEIDLGRYSLENISEVSMNIGHPTDIFQTARMFSSGSVLCLKTKLLEYDKNKNFEGKASIKTGSFGFINPSFFIAKNIGKKWAFNFSSDAVTANGEYKFLQYYGSKNNISEELKRSNTDIKSIRTEINGLYRIKKNENISLKANYFGSERGLPGSVTFYNHDDSKQRLEDKLFFVQLHYDNRVSPKFQHQYFAKFNRIFNHYSDKDPKYAGGILNDNYLQHEYYLSSTFKYNIIEALALSASTDWWYNDLDIESNINFKDFKYPTRYTGLANIAAKYSSNNMNVVANLLYTLTRESTKTGTASPNRNKLSPSISASYKLLEDKELRIRAFYKNIYRLPSFNDLYYQEIGNTNLRPENANQFDFGITYLENDIAFLDEFLFNLDAYYNKVTDKIIAIPRDLFHWSMINKGKVDIKGLDANLRMSVKINKQNNVKIMGSYTLLNAKDKTVGTDNYDEQIPYTPTHSGTCSVSFVHKKIETGYNLFFSGERWIGQITQPTNKMDGYMTHSIFANTSYKRLKISAEILNLLNTQYEVVQFYPMPRRNYRISLTMNLN